MQITIELPDDLQLTEADLRTELAIALFQQQRITLGTASELSGIHQVEFQRLIASRGICIHYDIEDLEQDLTSLRQDDEIDPDDAPTEVVLEGLRQGLHEALTGQTVPLSQLWEGVDAE